MALRGLGFFLIFLCPVIETFTTCQICPRHFSMCVRDGDDLQSLCTRHVSECYDIVGFVRGQMFNGHAFDLVKRVGNSTFYALSSTAVCHGHCCQATDDLLSAQITPHYYAKNYMKYINLTNTRGRESSGVLIYEDEHGHANFCFETWTLENTKVACRNLNISMPSAPVKFHAYHSHSQHHFVGLVNLNCQGNEHKLSSCQGIPLLSHNCSALVKIDCNAHDHQHQEFSLSHRTTLLPNHGSGTVLPTTLAHTHSAYFPVRLNSDGGLYAGEGRVEIFINGQWGTVCNNGWTWHNTAVICRMMGFNTAHSHMTRFKEGTGPIHLTQVACQGSEKSLSECRYTTTASAHCSHYEDVGVMCHDDITTPSATTSTSKKPGSTLAWHEIQ